uniref:Uncharacterized protein n=1 Tax=Rhizophora mucronata TaxID=61149 RepID=A0A2P2NIH3_RHIMU
MLGRRQDMLASKQMAKT